jgi:transposase
MIYISNLFSTMKTRLALIASKKGMSADQLSRRLDVSYKTGVQHRVRETMKDKNDGPTAGQNRVVESDKTLIGGKKTTEKSRSCGVAQASTLVTRCHSIELYYVAIPDASATIH